MFYEYDVTVPANTPKEHPVDTPVTLAAGVITWWEINFPSGCVGLAHAKVLDELHQVIPTNPDGDVKGDSIHVNTFDDIALDTEPYVLTLRCWNDDDTFEHMLTFRFAVLSAADKLQRDVAFSALSYLAAWFSQSQPATPAAGV